MSEEGITTETVIVLSLVMFIWPLVVCAAPYPNCYGKTANLTGAKPFHKKQVLQLFNQLKCEGSGLRPQLVKQKGSYPQWLKVLQQWCDTRTYAKGAEGAEGAVWMSDTLPFDLALPMEKPPPDSLCFQALVLAPGCPAVLIAVFDPERVPKHRLDVKTNKSKKEVNIYTLKTGSLLASAILNFCCCDVLLVPVTISLEDFTPEGLLVQVDLKVREAENYFRGPLILNKAVYMEVKNAVTAVVGTSCVPPLLRDSGLEGRRAAAAQDLLVLMDPEWRSIVSLLIEMLSRPTSELQEHTLKCPEEGFLKMEVALLESSRRLSFRMDVFITTERKELIENLKEKTKQDTGVELKLSDKPSTDEAVITLEVGDHVLRVERMKETDPVDMDKSDSPMKSSKGKEMVPAPPNLLPRYLKSRPLSG